MTEKGAIFPMFYLPPVSYFTQLITHKSSILLEKEEHFPKQTYRNRAHIYSPDGVLPLIIPVVKGAKNHTKIKDVRISYEFNWQRLHWLSLQGCYRRSAYFEFYEDEFARFYEPVQKPQFLFDFNEALFHMLLKMLKLKIDYAYTSDYNKIEDEPDFRQIIHPKRPSLAEQKPYFQVFDERHGFVKDLSVVDLIFSQGPQAQLYI
jgi:hypothetical protein